MASIIQVRGKWRAQLRISGMKSRCATFASEEAAKDWAQKEERALRAAKRGTMLDPSIRPFSYQQAGVYALFKGVEIQYIGRSVHVYRRLNDHDRKSKDWDGFKIWLCRDSIDAAQLEKKLIEKYRPPLNKAGVPAIDSPPL